MLAARNTALAYSSPHQPAGVIVATGADEGDISKYHQYTCPWLERLLRANWRTGGAGASHHLIADAELEKTECFSEFLGPRQFHYGMGAVIPSAGEIPAWLVILREKAKGPYSDEARMFLRALLPHMSQAFKLHGRITVLEHNRRGLVSALDVVSTGILILDAAGRVLFLNRRPSRSSSGTMASRSDAMVSRRRYVTRRLRCAGC